MIRSSMLMFANEFSFYSIKHVNVFTAHFNIISKRNKKNDPKLCVVQKVKK